MADNLESYFKKHLSGENPAEADWNIPSDDVWNKALPEIQKKRGLFIPWKYLYIIGALLILGPGIFLWPVVSSDDVSEQEPLSTTKTISNPDNSENSTENQTEIYSNTTDENQVRSEKDNQSTHEASNQPAIEDDLQNAIASTTLGNGQGKQQAEYETAQANLPADDIYKNTSRKTIHSSGTTILTNTNATQNLSKDENIFAVLNAGAGSGPVRGEVYIGYLQRRSTQNFLFYDEATDNLEARHVDNTPIEIQREKIEPYGNKGKVGIGAFYAPTWNGTSLSGDPQTGEIQTSDMLLYSGNWGFELKYFISNRFALVTGVEKSEIKSWSKSLVDFSYDTSTEHSLPDGEKENTSAVPMQTPFGEIETEVTYQFSGDQQIPDGEVMNSELETHQELRYLSIPLGVEFNILHFSRFSWFAEAGVRYNRALKDATRFSSRILHSGDDMAVVDEKMMNYPTYTENYMSFYIGTGMNYQFSSKFQINASGRYFGNITDVNLQGNMSTYVHGYSLKIGILYLF